VHPGAGPRHLAFHPELPLVYVTNEMDSTVTSLRFDRERGSLAVGQTLSALPKEWTGQSFAADIHVARDGRTLYASNRGHNSIAVFQIDSAGALRLEQTISTGGDWPRNFALDPSGRWLLVANQRSGSIVVLARDPRTGRLVQSSQRIEIPSPVCLVPA
jgi:6-phosphogluconolactonase